MLEIYSESNIDLCRELWKEVFPQERLTDLWDVRFCFQKNYECHPLFVIAKRSDKIVGFIPLSYIAEEQYYAYFPGETWKGKTWLEQNRIMVQDEGVFERMLGWLKEKEMFYYLRYLNKEIGVSQEFLTEDEIGYLFHPPAFEFKMDNYFKLFSRKSLKTIRRETDGIYDQGVTFRTDSPGDFEAMIAMNIERFGDFSYFSDERFKKSFEDLRVLLENKGWLKMTAVIIDGQIAAVDMGCFYKGGYTLLAGGTHSNYPGVAKVINLHHMNEACANRYQEVDFLCGDFTWKKNFHLMPRPLYEISNMHE